MPDLVLCNYVCVYDTAPRGFSPSLLEDASSWKRFVLLDVCTMNYVVKMSFLWINWEWKKHTLSFPLLWGARSF